VKSHRQELIKSSSKDKNENTKESWGREGTEGGDPPPDSILIPMNIREGDRNPERKS